MIRIGRRAWAAFFLAYVLGIIWAAPARAKTIQIDDSGSEALEPSVGMRWKSATPSHSSADNLMIGATTIRVRLNLTPWLRRSGRIYLNLPAQPPGPIALSWLTQGRLQAGQVQSGGRMLVYAGPITTPFMEDTLTFRFGVDGRLIQHAFPVNFHFEMDED